MLLSAVGIIITEVITDTLDFCIKILELAEDILNASVFILMQTHGADTLEWLVTSNNKAMSWITLIITTKHNWMDLQQNSRRIQFSDSLLWPQDNLESSKLMCKQRYPNL